MTWLLRRLGGFQFSNAMFRVLYLSIVFVQGSQRIFSSWELCLAFLPVACSFLDAEERLAEGGGEQLLRLDQHRALLPSAGPRRQFGGDRGVRLQVCSLQVLICSHKKFSEI